MDLTVGKKRKPNNIIQDLNTSKKLKIDKLINATATKNYLIDDSLVDYLEFREYNNKTITDLFLGEIMDEGIQFEKEIIINIKENHPIIEAKTPNDTIKLMKEGIPIISQAPIINSVNGTYSKPDLLINSTYINNIFPDTISNDMKILLTPNKLGLNYYYIPIEIKHSKFKSAKNREAYKGQMYIYLTALNNILGTTFRKGYFLCKDNINKLITVDYSEESKDHYIVDKVKKALQWLRDVEEFSHSWVLYPIPSRPELFPNLKVYNKKYDKIKQEISKQIGGDITALCNCGIKERINAHKNGIFSLSDKKLSAKMMGFSENDMDGKLVDAILEINRQRKYVLSCENKKLTYNLDEWKNIDMNTTQEFVIDIETFNSKFRVNLDGTPESDYIFLTGIGYMDNNDNWIFKYFIMKDKTRQSEAEAIDNFLDYIKNTLLLLGKEKAILYHWSKFEDTQFKKYYERNTVKKNINFYKFCDLYKVFTKEPITIKGALNFKLKTIGKILYKHDMIETCWDIKNECCDGLNAMVLGEILYSKYNNLEDIMQDKNMLDIIQYNEMDCRVLCDIHNLIKKY
jgi:hypothetical protein